MGRLEWVVCVEGGVDWSGWVVWREGVDWSG